MKCQRCGSEAVKSEGKVMDKPRGPDATVALRLQGRRGLLTAAVCEGCAEMLRKLGWK